MRLAGVVLLAAGVLAAADGPHFDITDARGKKPAGVTVEAGAADADGWFALKVAKAKGDPVLVWPFDGAAKMPDGPEAIPVIVMERGDARALANRRVVAAMATPVVLGVSSMEMIAQKTGLEEAALRSAAMGLAQASDAFEKGVGLAYANKQADAAEALARAFKDRQNQLTRIPSEIYPAALLYGQELSRSNKFDDAAVAFLAALKQRPSDQRARELRSDALVRAGKPEAAGR